MALPEMKRKLYDQLVSWKQQSKGRTALLLEGARRVGKGYLAEMFAKREFKSYLVINFDQVDDDIKDLFNKYLTDLDTLFSYLQAITEVKLYPGESLIIFDEVQQFPRARSAIKYLVADGRYYYLETGSLVSIREHVKDIVIPSEERHLRLYPMDFEEFMWAIGQDLLYDAIVQHFHDAKPMGQALHRKAMDCFRQYLLVGGMPQAVQEYVATHDFSAVDMVKRNILTLYRSDINKHAVGYERKVEAIFDEIPEQLGKHEKRFFLSSLGNGARFREYESSFLWLDDSMIVNMCFNSTQPSIGLKMNRDSTTMKLYMADTGLLISHAFDEQTMASGDIYRKLLFGKLEFNEGMIFENVVAQMLTASGHKLYFYANPGRGNKNERMRIDFLIAKRHITNRHDISPIEVKSGTRYTLSSLRKFMALYKEQLSVPYVIHTGDWKCEEGITYLPAYMTGLL